MAPQDKSPEAPDTKPDSQVTGPAPGAPEPEKSGEGPTLDSGPDKSADPPVEKTAADQPGDASENKKSGERDSAPAEKASQDQSDKKADTKKDPDKDDSAEPETEQDRKKRKIKKLVIIGAIVLGLGLAGYYLWDYLRDDGPGEGFAGGNGRIEATEIDISTKLAGRIEEIKVKEGDFVEAGQVLAVMQTSVLEAQLAEARAQYQQALTRQASAQSQVAVKESDKKAAEANVVQRESELDAIQRRLDRTTVLTKQGAVPVQTFDDQETSMHGAQAAVTSAKAQVAVAQSAIDAAKADVEGAKATIKAAQATIERIEADIKDSTLVAPRTGRIQYRIAQEGEVLGAGGKVLNLVDLTDVYMTFFLPATEAGLVSYGSEARIVLDAAPDNPIPATLTYVASTAQFTPKTVETASEREKLMFRIKAQIDPKLLNEYIQYVKTGLPGVVWVRLDPSKEWPDSLKLKTRNE